MLLHTAQNAANILAETNVKHAVHFIKHRNFDIVVGQNAALIHVHHATRRAHNNCGTGLQLSGLRVDAAAAVHRHHFVAAVFGELHEFLGHLNGKLASWHKHQAAEGIGLVKARQHGQREGGGLAGARLGLAQAIFSGQRHWKKRGLNAGWILKALFIHGFKKCFWKSKVGEFFTGVESFC